jgi:hypothetical protein
MRCWLGTKVSVSQEEFMEQTHPLPLKSVLIRITKVQKHCTGCEVNQAIKFMEHQRNFDYRTFYKIYLREQGKIYGFYDLINEQKYYGINI